MTEKDDTGVENGLFEGLLEALANKHSQLDVDLQNVTIKLPRAQVTVELNGLVTVTAHVRELTEDEKQASSTRNVALMTHPGA